MRPGVGARSGEARVDVRRTRSGGRHQAVGLLAVALAAHALAVVQRVRVNGRPPHLSRRFGGDDVVNLERAWMRRPGLVVDLAASSAAPLRDLEGTRRITVTTTNLSSAPVADRGRGERHPDDPLPRVTHTAAFCHEGSKGPGWGPPPPRASDSNERSIEYAFGKWLAFRRRSPGRRLPRARVRSARPAASAMRPAVRSRPCAHGRASRDSRSARRTR